MAPAVEVEADTVVEDWPPAREVELTLDQPGQAVIGGPAVQKEALFSHALAERAEVARGQARLPKRQMHPVQLMPAVAAVLLALARHAVHERFLGAVVERIERRIKKPLQRSLAGLRAGLVRPRKDPAAHVQVTDGHRSFGVVNVQLQPAQAFVVERLEVVQPIPADEARPGIEMSVQQGWPAGRVGLVNEQLDGSPRRGLDIKAGPAYNLVLELEGERGSTRAIQLNAPLARGSFNGNLFPRGLEGIGDPEIEVILRRGMPFEPQRLGQFGHRYERLPQQRDAARAQF